MAKANTALPPELLPHRVQVEEYVSARLKQFASRFAAHVAPQLTHAQVQQAVADLTEPQSAGSSPVLATSPTATAALAATNPITGASPGSSQLQLVFRHDCLALGCRDSECTLCQYNPMRLCDRSFSKKYLVGDTLKAKCGAGIKVDVKRSNGAAVEEDLPGVHFEVSLIDGVMYKEKLGDGRALSSDDLRSCIKFTNHRDEALLQLKTGVSSSTSRKVLLKAERGHLALPELQVTDSSEALLTGRKPPFRVVVFAVGEDMGMLPGFNYAVSEEFVVATRRVKQANKADIPLVDDHVSKIEHIGRETVKKLTDMRAAATEIGMTLQLPDKLLSTTTVGQFLTLVDMAEKDAQLKKVLQIVLKLSKEKWEEAAAHATTAVVSDFRKRIWYPPGHNMNLGLLFSAKYGGVQLREPVSLVQLNGPLSAGNFKVTPEDELDPASLNTLRQLKQQAVQAWWNDGHPGWGIFKEPGSEMKLDPRPEVSGGAGLQPSLPSGSLSANAALQQQLAAIGAVHNLPQPSGQAHTNNILHSLQSLPSFTSTGLSSKSAQLPSFTIDANGKLQIVSSLTGDGERAMEEDNRPSTRIELPEAPSLRLNLPTSAENSQAPMEVEATDLFTPFASGSLPPALQQELNNSSLHGAGDGHGHGGHMQAHQQGQGQQVHMSTADWAHSLSLLQSISKTAHAASAASGERSPKLKPASNSANVTLQNNQGQGQQGLPQNGAPILYYVPNWQMPAAGASGSQGMQNSSAQQQQQPPSSLSNSSGSLNGLALNSPINSLAALTGLTGLSSLNPQQLAQLAALGNLISVSGMGGANSTQ